jgi:hypothetical protein
MNETRPRHEHEDWQMDETGTFCRACGQRVTPRHTDQPVADQTAHKPCGCGIPNRSAYWYVIPMHRDGTWERATVRIYRCVKHRVDPRDLLAVRLMFEFDHADEWVIDDVECKPAARHAREADLTAAFRTPGTQPEPRFTWSGWEAETDLDNGDDRPGVHYLTIWEGRPDEGDEVAVIIHRGPVDVPTVATMRKAGNAQRIVDALNPQVPSIREAAAAPVEVDVRLRSRSEEEDMILRHYRGSLHNAAQCAACKQEQFERRIGDRRVAECHAERDALRASLAERDAKVTHLRIVLNSIIEG